MLTSFVPACLKGGSVSAYVGFICGRAGAQ